MLLITTDEGNYVRIEVSCEQTIQYGKIHELIRRFLCEGIELGRERILVQIIVEEIIEDGHGEMLGKTVSICILENPHKFRHKGIREDFRSQEGTCHIETIHPCLFIRETTYIQAVDILNDTKY